MTVNYDSGLYGYDQATVTFDGTDNGTPKTRFILDASTLNDFSVGLDGAFPFTTTAVGSAGLGGLAGSAVADVVVAVQAVGVAELGGLAGSVSASVSHQAVGSAVLGSVSGSVSPIVVHSVAAVAGLGAGVGLATSSVLVRPYADGQLGSMVGSAQATVVPQPTPTPSYPSGGNPWYRQPKVPVEKVSVVSVEVELPRVPERIVVSGSSVVSLSASATSEVTWSILEDEAELLLLV
jgi:hypothetical protein